MQPTPKKRFHDGLNEGIKRVLLGQIRTLWTHTSTAIEGNRLTLGDTAFILEEGLTVSGKPLKDHQEVYAHARAIDLIYQWIECEEITKADVFALHRAIQAEHIMDIYHPVGGWKVEPNYTSFVSGEGRQAIREYPAPQHTDKLMGQWLQRFNDAFKKDDFSMEEVGRVYARLHLDFVTIHPFCDGNGRMARLISNLPVLKSGFPPIVIPDTDRRKYKQIISDYQEAVHSLATLDDLDRLPENENFRNLCTSYWIETMRLVDEAHRLQTTSREI
ncbi:MAG: Fic family protein [Rhodocyclaceae bacterium]|nr:Fic family protein [Rhodocyclaceae bacterium]